jgi:REP element-mobilizing transposase RayT
MDRKTPFIEGEIYHIYTRGVEKRTVFTSKMDYERFVMLLLLSNSRGQIRIGNLLKRYKGKSTSEILRCIDPTHEYTDVLGYALMPNHIHLILKEKRSGGISTFMHKLITSYAMYFNIKNDRSGPLFTRPFRSRHVDDDPYLRWLFSYIHLNPLELSQPGWKNGRIEAKSAAVFLRNYAFSSYPDFFFVERPESIILNKSAWPIDPRELREVDELLKTFSSFPEYQGLPLL